MRNSYVLAQLENELTMALLEIIITRVANIENVGDSECFDNMRVFRMVPIA